MKVFFVSLLILVCAGLLSWFIYAWATSEILLAHGTVTDKTYVQEHWDHYTRTDSEGRTHLESTYHAPEHWITVNCPEYVFTMDRRDVYVRFKVGDRVKLTYLSKLHWVKRVYAEEDQILVER